MTTTALMVNAMLQANELKCITKQGNKLSLRTLQISRPKGSKILANDKEGCMYILTVQDTIPYITQDTLDREASSDIGEVIQQNTEINLPWAYSYLNSDELKRLQEIEAVLIAKIEDLKYRSVISSTQEVYINSLSLICVSAKGMKGEFLAEFS